MNCNKITCGPKPWIFPLPVAIIGVEAEGRAEYTVTENAAPLCVSPPIIYISLPGKNSLAGTIKAKGYFSLNTPSTSMLPEISALKANGTIDNINTLAAESGVPYMSECPINLICRVEDSFSVNNMEVFIGRVEHTYISTQCLTQGNRNPELNKIDPILYSPGQGYYSIGKYLGEAFSIGKCYGKGISGNIKHLVRSTGKKSILKGYSGLTSAKKLLSNTKGNQNQKTEIPARALIYPVPTALPGSKINEKPNYSVIANCGRISEDPAIVCVSSVKSHFTNKGINSNCSFSINIPDISLIKQTDYCGIVSGSKTDKSKVFTTFAGKDDKIPLIKECPVNLECRVIKIYTLKHMEVFIGEVIESHISEKCIESGKPDIQKINPIVYALNRKYWSIGKPL